MEISLKDDEKTDGKKWLMGVERGRLERGGTAIGDDENQRKGGGRGRGETIKYELP